MVLDQRFFDTWNPRALAALRLVAAFLYLQHGTAKLLHLPHVAEFDSLPALSLVGFAGMLEIVGSLLLLLGLFTRPTAFILSGEMAVAYFMAQHRKATSSPRHSIKERRRFSTALSSCFCPLPAAAPGALMRAAAADNRSGPRVTCAIVPGAAMTQVDRGAHSFVNTSICSAESTQALRRHGIRAD
jgi:uncharacterized membrane protein YphA (DoxX/SURF4 family)